ncbi:MAG: hypothetical protein LBB26_02085 [Puniceicoccales bacterium]|nr:hypothetical protein [Puniceicoccales bacterium]
MVVTGLLPAMVLVLAVWRPFGDDSIRCFLFSRRVNSAVFLAGAGCLFWKFSTLGDADFGEHRKVIEGFLALLAAGALWRNYGFLVVRGIVILQLLWSAAILNALLDNYQWWSLALKVFVYVIVLESLYLAVCPYRLRDWWTQGRAQGSQSYPNKFHPTE